MKNTLLDTYGFQAACEAKAAQLQAAQAFKDAAIQTRLDDIERRLEQIWLEDLNCNDGERAQELYNESVQLEGDKIELLNLINL
jgi:hypothetical protein